jgi:hypothetical protein
MCTASGYCWDNDKLKEEIVRLGNEIREQLGFSIGDLFDETSSKFFREIYVNPTRVEMEKF